jgi:hypothetical protein
MEYRFPSDGRMTEKFTGCSGKAHNFPSIWKTPSVLLVGEGSTNKHRGRNFRDLSEWYDVG